MYLYMHAIIIIIHVMKRLSYQSYAFVLLNLHTHLDTVVEFSSSRYIGSESLKGVPVTLLLTQGFIYAGEEIVINVVATSHSPVSAEGVYVYICIKIVITQTQGICLMYMPKPKGRRPESVGIYIRKILSTRVVTNI